MLMPWMILVIMAMLMTFMMMIVAGMIRLIFITFNMTFAFGTAASTAHGMSPDIVIIGVAPTQPRTV